MAHASDRKCLPLVHQTAFSERERHVTTDARYGATVFAAKNELLTIRRPLQSPAMLDDMVDFDIRANRMLSWYSRGRGSFRPMDTPPFASRGWSFGLLGDVPERPATFLSAEEEAFCLRCWRGRSVVELMGLQLNYRLFRGGNARVDEPPAEQVRDQLVDLLESYASTSFHAFTVMVTNATTGLVFSKHRSVHYCTVRGDFRRSARIDISGPYVDHLRAAVISDGLDILPEVGPVILPSGSFLALERETLRLLSS